MADNITLNTMAGGSTVATDDSGSGHVQIVKLAYSADGSKTSIPADVDGLLVNIGNAAVLVTQGGGAWAVTQASGPWTVIERGNSIFSGNASVTTTSDVVLAANPTRRTVVLTNLGSDYVWVGPSSIMVNEGIRLAPGQTLTIDRAPTPAIWAVAASGTQIVAWFAEAD